MATYKLFSVHNTKKTWDLAKKGAIDAKIIGKMGGTKKATLAAAGIGAGLSTAYLVGKSIKDKKSRQSNN